MNKTKVIHCRVTEDQHAEITEKARDNGMSITQFVVKTIMEKVSKAEA